jgi:hypothetical protein
MLLLLKKNHKFDLNNKIKTIAIIIIIEIKKS